jgi:hypothetical protein
MIKLIVLFNINYKTIIYYSNMTNKRINLQVKAWNEIFKHKSY